MCDNDEYEIGHMDGYESGKARIAELEAERDRLRGTIAGLEAGRDHVRACIPNAVLTEREACAAIVEKGADKASMCAALLVSRAAAIRGRPAP